MKENILFFILLTLNFFFFRLVDESGATYDRMHLKDWFNNPHPMLKSDVLDGVIRGLVLANPEASDELFVSEVKKKIDFILIYFNYFIFYFFS